MNKRYESIQYQNEYNTIGSNQYVDANQDLVYNQGENNNNTEMNTIESKYEANDTHQSYMHQMATDLPIAD